MNSLKIGQNLLYLTKEDCTSNDLSRPEIVSIIERGLTYQANKVVEMPAKIGIHPLHEDTFIHAMPSYIKPEAACGIKWVSGYPENPKRHNLAHIEGLIIVNDDQTGFPLAIMDGSWITTMRTVAATIIGAKYLKKSSSNTYGIIGCGNIGRNHIEFINDVFPDTEFIYIYDNYEKAMDEVIETYQSKVNFKIIKAKSIEELTKSVETVISATIFSKPSPLIDDSWIQEGQTILLCDSHALYEDKTIKRANKYIIDSLEQGKHFETLGYYPEGLPNVHSELGEVVAGLKKGRENNKELIINNNIGMSLEDIILAKYIYEDAVKNNKGTVLPL